MSLSVIAKENTNASVDDVVFSAALAALPLGDSRAVSIDIYTDGGAKPNPGMASLGVWAKDSDGNTFDIYGFVGSNSTNNRAELFGYIRALELVIRGEWSDVNLYLDSKYVLDGATKYIHNWNKNGWKKQNGDVISNKTEWVRVYELLNHEVIKSININQFWVKGHTGKQDEQSLGNERADANATLGIVAGNNGDYATHIEMIDKDAVVEPAKKVKKPEPCNKLIAGKRLIWTTNTVTRTSDGMSVYTTTSFEDGSGKNGKYLGKPASDNMFGVVLTKEPIPQLESLIDYQSSITPDDFVQPVIGVLDRIVRPDNWQGLTLHGHAHLKHERLNVLTQKNEPLTVYMRPPRLAYDAMDALSVMYERLGRYRSGKEGGDETYLDITELFYHMDGKHWKLNAGLGKSDKAVIVKTDTGDDVILTLGVDVCPRNNLSGICKKTPHLKVTLVKYAQSDVGFRYCVVFENDHGIAMYSTGSANYRTTLKTTKK